MLSSTPRSRDIRAALESAVNQRLQTELAKVEGKKKETAKLREYFNTQSLLEKGAAVARQIQMATHIAKAIHPDLMVKHATHVLLDPQRSQQLAASMVVGSHLLKPGYQTDATGNGSHNKVVFEVFRILQTLFEGVPILHLLKIGDCDAIRALGEENEEGTRYMQWASDFAQIDAPRCPTPATSGVAKQLYWLTGQDPHDDTHYHLLVPLHPSSLVHQLHNAVRQERFTQEAQEARKAMKEGDFCATPVRKYPQLAIRKIGGSKPLNISHINSIHVGNSPLLASLPPSWNNSKWTSPLLNSDSMLHRYSARPQVRTLVKTLRDFLNSDPAPNRNTRTRCRNLLEDLTGEFFQFTAELRALTPGWSQNNACRLSLSEKHWLDPQGCEQSCQQAGEPVPQDTAERISADFANWLNDKLRNPLPMGDDQFHHWYAAMSDEIKAFEKEYGQ